MASDLSGLIVPEMGRQILQAATESSVVLQLAAQQRMTTHQLQIPVLSALPEASFIAGIGEPKPVTEMAWSRKMIQAEEVAALLPIPTSYIDDASFNVWGEVRPRLAEAVAKAIDYAVLGGIDAPPSFPDGGVVAAAGAPITAAAPPAQPDIAEAVSQAMARVEAGGLNVNGFAARSTVRGAMRGVRTTTGEWLMWAPQQAGAPATMWGSPLTFTSMGFGAAPVDLIAGDWNALVIGLREDMRFDISTEGVIRSSSGEITVSAFQDDVAIMRVFMRLGAVIGTPIVHLPDSDEVTEGTAFAAVKRSGSTTTPEPPEGSPPAGEIEGAAHRAEQASKSTTSTRTSR